MMLPNKAGLKTGGKIDWKKTATQKELGIWGGVLLLILFMGFKNYISPLNTNLKTNISQLEAKKLEFATYQKLMKSKPGGKANDKMEVGKQAVARKVKDAFDRSNTSGDVVLSELLAELTKAEYARMAFLEKFNFVSEKKMAGYSEMMLDLRLVGTYDGIADYIGVVRSLAEVIKIETVDIKPMDQQNKNLVRLIAKLTLFVGDPKAAPVAQSTTSRSDTATDILIELNASKVAKSPFAVRPRDMGAWSVQELRLTSTMAGSSRPSALINGKLFELGDEVAEFRLVEVRPQEVVLQRGEVQFVLKISDKLGVSSEDGEKRIFQRAPESAPEALHAPAESTPENSTTQPLETNIPLPSRDSKPPTSENLIQEEVSPNSVAEQEGEAELSEEESQLQAANQMARQRAARGNEFISGEKLEGQEEELEEGGSGVSAAQPTTPGKRKLKPSEVEDIAGVPFEDLEDPMEALEHLWS